jgi:hypothetical protein
MASRLPNFTAAMVAGAAFACATLCSTAPAIADPEAKPPVDQTRVLIVPQGLSVKVVIEDLSNLPTQCTYRATPIDNFLLPDVNRDFSMSKRGSQQFTFLAPPLGSTYHLVTSCHANWQGQDVEVGHVEQDLPGGYLGG